MIGGLNSIKSYDVLPAYSSRKTAESTAAAHYSGTVGTGEAVKKNVAKEVKPIIKKDAAAEVKNSKKQFEQTTVRFKLHKGTGATMIQIVDSSGKVIKEMPPEKLLDSIAQIWKNAGINIDKSV